MSSYESIKTFEYQTRNIDLSAIKDGQFKAFLESNRAKKELKFAKIYDTETKLNRLFYNSKFKITDTFYILISYFRYKYYKWFDCERIPITYESFFLEYYKIRKSGDLNLLEAKKLETKTKNHQLAFEAYEKAHNEFSKLENLIHENRLEIHYARTKFRIKSSLWLFFTFIGSIILEKVLEKLFKYDFIEIIYQYFF